MQDREQLVFQRFYEVHFREIFGSEPVPEDGLGGDAVEDRLAIRGLAIPKALFDYYSILGHHVINNGRHRLRTIEELEWHDDWLVFMEEDHGMICWGIHRHDLTTPDPVVWQGVQEEEMLWLQADTPLSQFLIDKWKEGI
jgi:hypothetical protein